MMIENYVNILLCVQNLHIESLQKCVIGVNDFMYYWEQILYISNIDIWPNAFCSFFFPFIFPLHIL